MLKSLDEIRGVGEKVKKQLITHYGSETMALSAVENREFEGLIEAGISFQKSVDIARYITSLQDGFKYAQITKTKEAKELFNSIFEILRSYPKTDFGKIGISLFSPTLDEGEIGRRIKYSRDCIELAKKTQGKRHELSRHLTKISALKEEEPRIDDLIATEDEEIYHELTKRLQRSSNILYIESADDLEYLRDFDFVRYVQRNSRFSDQVMGLSNVEPVYDEDIEQIAPELVISFYGVNKECIISAMEISRISSDSELMKYTNQIEGEIELIKALDREGIDKKSYKRIEELSAAIAKVDSVSQKALDEANTRISQEIGNMSLKGGEVLEMLKKAQTSSLIGSLPPNFNIIISKIAGEQEDLIAQNLHIDAALTSGLLSMDSDFLEIDSQRLAEIKQQLMIDVKKLEFNTMQEIAKRLSTHFTIVKKLIRKTLEFDLRMAVGTFCIDNLLVEPVIQDNLGIGINGGKNMLLKGDVQAVDYVLGSSTQHPENSERATVITGANSGGKTTLLELIGQIVILTNMGLGVPAKQVTCSLFDEIYYFGKGQGNSAGAFETILKTFGELSKSSKGRRIILADEIEAITEPGAAAKVLASLLEWFKDDKNTLITMVTHLGEEIKEHVTEGIRIDGIEARGLDKDFNLIVNRNPKLGKIARSTPELIVDRLSRTSSEKGLYNKILERFNKLN